MSVMLLIGFPKFSLGKKNSFVDLRIFTLVEGEKMKCEVILP